MEVTVRALVANFLKDESGVTAIEYGLIAALIAVVCIAAWSAIGTGLQGAFQSIQSSV
jgi:pilus assembly protein Flp/PilA